MQLSGSALVSFLNPGFRSHPQHCQKRERRMAKGWGVTLLGVTDWAEYFINLVC